MNLVNKFTASPGSRSTALMRRNSVCSRSSSTVGPRLVPALACGEYQKAHCKATQDIANPMARSSCKVPGISCRLSKTVLIVWPKGILQYTSICPLFSFYLVHYYGSIWAIWPYGHMMLYYVWWLTNACLWKFPWPTYCVAIIWCQRIPPHPCCKQLETKQLRVSPLSPATSSTRDTQST